MAGPKESRTLAKEIDNIVLRRLRFRPSTGTSVLPQPTQRGDDDPATFGGNVEQDLWAKIIGNAGDTTADSPTDELSILGALGIVTTIVGDTLVIDFSGTYADVSNNDGDTNVTGLELEALTDGSSTALHTHDHGTLGGRGGDDHSGHPWLPGRSGGQTLHGGTAANNSLFLRSTSNATRGTVHIGQASSAGGLVIIGSSGTVSFRDASDVTGILLQQIAGAAGTIFNEAGVDINFRVEGDTDENLLLIDASTDRIGIGLFTPLAKLHIDQVDNAAAIPVLTLDQADISEGCINFIASDRGPVLTAMNDGIGIPTLSAASVRVEIGGTVYLLALFANQ